MRCKTARDYFCRNRDGILDEATRIKLQRHLAGCPACAAWCGEMEECAKLLSLLPEMETSENFEWNLKRRIAFERSRAMRNRTEMSFGALAWGGRFVAGAAVALGVVFTAALLLGVRVPSREAPIVTSSQGGGKIAAARRSEEGVRFSPAGYQAGIRRVSDESFGDGAAADSARPLPFRIAADPRIDNLLRENELLRRQVLELQRQNVVVRNLLLKCSSERESSKREARR